MNVLTFYVLATNFLGFWTFVLYMLWQYHLANESGVVFFLAFVSFVIVAAVISLLPFILPTIGAIVIGAWVMGVGEGVWLLEFIGGALLFGGIGVMFLFGQVSLDSLKARYWRHMWTHKSPLENRMGASSPHTTMESDGDWRIFFFPVIAPFLYLGMKMEEESREMDKAKDKEN